MKKLRKHRLWIVLAAALFTVIAATGFLYHADNVVSDALYQKRTASDGQIVLVGIDQKAIEMLGPVSGWTRDIMAMTIETLNQSSEVHPAVIGIDVLYVGATDPSLDAWLAEAAGLYGNVVVGCAAQYGTSLEETGVDSMTLDDFSVLMVEEPFTALKDLTVQGHINAMLDKDGILRHQLWEVRYGGETIPSFASVIADKYCKEIGEEPCVAPPIDERGFWYLPYSGKPGDYSESISLADVLWGEVPAEYFADKIVLIGPYAPSLQDDFFTSIDHASPMYGIECHANAIEAILAGNYKKEVPEALQLGVLFVLLVAAGLFFWKRKMLPSTIVWLAGVMVAVGGCYLAYELGYVLHVLWLPLGLTCFYVGCIAFNYISAALEKRRVTMTFKKYVAPQVVNEILASGEYEKLTVGGRLVDIAVLFVDIRGFTTMSESLKPDEVVEILNRYLTLIATCILDAQGTLDKFIGDAAMAFWGAPLAQEDYVLHALEAAMAMKKGADKLSRELLERYGRTVSFGIGVHVGEALVGNIGSPDRMDYTAIGDTVNTASRLESIAPKETIYISQEVVDRMGARIVTKQLEEKVKLKGKAEPLTIYTLEEIVG